MEMNKRKSLIILAIVVVVIVIVALIVNGINNENNGNNNTTNNLDTYERYVQVLAAGSKINVSSKLLETKTYEDIEITNISLKYEKGITTLIADVTNKGTAKEEQKVSVILEDENGNTVATLNGVIDKVEENKTVQLNISTTKDVVNVYNFRIEQRY